MRYVKDNFSIFPSWFQSPRYEARKPFADSTTVVYTSTTLVLGVIDDYTSLSFRGRGLAPTKGNASVTSLLGSSLTA